MQRAGLPAPPSRRMVAAMQEAAILESLFELAREAGIEVRAIGASASGEGQAPPASGICRVRGAVWVLISRHETSDLQIEILARALREHAAALLDERFLPPAVRARVFPEGVEDEPST